MSRLIESIKLQNGNFHRLQYHQQRVDRAISELFQIKSSVNLLEILKQHSFPRTGLYKCRIIYTTKIELIEFVPYQIRPVSSLKVVYDNAINYQHKLENRTPLNTLFDQRQYCDDVIIVKNGFVTDASYSNVLFYDGNKWVTSNTPLLKGTMRQFLLDTAEIKEMPITIQDIPNFKTCRLVNSMLGFDGPEIDVSKIVL
jgi:4-amino-4-deoxychorismate lyase